MFDEPPAGARCDSYRAHQSAYRHVGDRWVCDACNSDNAAREPEVPAPKNAAPHEPAELRDWLAAPPWEPDEATSDDWGTIG